MKLLYPILIVVILALLLILTENITAAEPLPALRFAFVIFFMIVILWIANAIESLQIAIAFGMLAFWLSLAAILHFFVGYTWQPSLIFAVLPSIVIPMVLFQIRNDPRCQ